MANYIVTASYTSTIGNGLDLPGSSDFAYIGPGVMLGTAIANGRGIYVDGSFVSVQIAGSVFGAVGVEIVNGGDVIVIQGGSVLASQAAVWFQVAGTLTNAGTISGYYGVVSETFGNIPVTYVSVNNSGSIFGEIDGITAHGGLILTNTGMIKGDYRGVFVAGEAIITNLGTIIGGISTSFSADVIVNQGVVSGPINTLGGDDVVDNTGGRLLSVVYLGDGNDTFTGGSFTDLLIGDAGRDDLSGAGGDDRFYAQDADGNDDIDGGTGIDIYDASAVTVSVTVNLTTGIARSGGNTDDLTGIERVLGGSGKDSLTGDALANTLSGNAGNDVLIGNAGNDRLIGGIGNDSLSGGEGNDRLLGNEGRDTLNGGAGDDVLVGSYDVDVMTGSTGADRFVWTEFDEFLGVLGGIDRITDFTTGDTIDLSAIDALAAGGDQAFTFVGAGPITDFGQISIRTTATATFVAISLNSAAPFEVIRLDGVIALTAADFAL